MSDIAYVDRLPDCDLCKERRVKTQAKFDGRTKMGPWANMCSAHFETFGVGLGTGKGQRLVVGEKPGPDPGAIQAAIEAGDYEAFEDLVGDADPMGYLG